MSAEGHLQALVAKWRGQQRGWLREQPNYTKAQIYSVCADELDAVLAATPEPAPPSGWQPIETAPKDGRVLLAYWGDTPQFIGWDGEGWRVLMPPARGMGFGIHGNFAPFQPTHWMPLPAPPTMADPPSGAPTGAQK